MEYSKEVTFPDSDEEEGSSLVEVSEKTKQFIHSKFTVSVPSEERKLSEEPFFASQTIGTEDSRFMR